MQEQVKLQKALDDRISKDETFVVALDGRDAIVVSNRDGDKALIEDPVGRPFEEDIFVSGVEADGVIHLQTRDGAATVSVGVNGEVCGEVGDPDLCQDIRDALDAARCQEAAADKHWGNLEARAAGLSLGEGR